MDTLSYKLVTETIVAPSESWYFKVYAAAPKLKIPNINLLTKCNFVLIMFFNWR